MKCNIRRLRKASVFLILFSVLLGTAFLPNAHAADVTSAAGLVTTASGSLNVRSAASTAGAVLTKLPTGTYVTLISKTGSWWQIEYAPSSYGYVNSDYIKYVYGTYPAAASSSSGSIQAYSGPDLTYAVQGYIPGGRTVIVLSQNGNWLRIIYNGIQSGYVQTQKVTSLMAWPVPNSHKINQYFGTHLGIDIGAAVRTVPGDSVIAAQQGKVVYAGWLNGYGYVVYINSIYNGQPIQTRYGHLNSAPLVSAGSVVGIGQRIGFMGNTGTSTGVHLHFEVRLRNSNADCIANIDSTPVNPLSYVK
jgi:murein DD-endopeptidase MepM/ murein hydrolase activator NlpD